MKNMTDIFSPHNKWVEEYTDGEWNKVVYWQGRIWLERWVTDEDLGIQVKQERMRQPIGGVWSMNTWETDKGPDFGVDKGGISNIVLDEALSKGGEYLYDEWGIFQNVIATLVRDRWEKDTKIWLLANPVSKWTNPYFRNMGITKQLLNTPGIYEITYPKAKEQDKQMSTIFCYIAAVTDKYGNIIDIDENRTNVYNTFFAFPNSKGKSQSITHGYWEMDDCALLPPRYYNDSEKNRTFYLKTDEENITACDIMKYYGTDQYYLFFYPTDHIREKTYYITILPEMERYAIIAGNRNQHRIYQLFRDLWDTGRVYYSDAMTADAVHGWIKEAAKRIT